MKGEHPVAWHRRLAGLPTTWRRDPELLVDDTEMAECRRWLERSGLHDAPLVLIQPGNRKTSAWRISRSDHKIWPVPSWSAVARGVVARCPDARVLLIGAPKEQALAHDIERSCNDPRIISVADQLPLRRLFALQRHAHSLISVDTGPAHAAAALGCPVVVLFGHDPRPVGPITGLGPCRIVQPPDTPPLDSTAPWPQRSGMDDLTPAAVLQAWDRLPQLAGVPLLTA
jgi:heptosyltransferase-2/heptosyltransferase-3